MFLIATTTVPVLPDQCKSAIVFLITTHTSPSVTRSMCNINPVLRKFWCRRDETFWCHSVHSFRPLARLKCLSLHMAATQAFWDNSPSFAQVLGFTVHAKRTCKQWVRPNMTRSASRHAHLIEQGWIHLVCIYVRFGSAYPPEQIPVKSAMVIPFSSDPTRTVHLTITGFQWTYKFTINIGCLHII